MESVVRAVGRIVVWVEADADVRMEIASRSKPTLPSNPSPYSVGPIALNTSEALLALPSPIPWPPTPANAMAATETSRYVSNSSPVEMTAARPGVRPGSSDSSLVATAVSQPQ